MPSTQLDISGVSEDAVHLRDFMSGVLERVQNIFQSYNVELPARRYWTMGQPALDCEQLVVSFIQLYLGAPGSQVGEPQRCNQPRTATINIQLSRTTPIVSMNGRPPLPEKIEEASSIMAVDSWVLMESINSLDMWDDTGYGLGVVATLDAGSPEGGFQTTTMTVTMAVP